MTMTGQQPDSKTVNGLKPVQYDGIHLLLDPTLIDPAPWPAQLATPWLCLDGATPIPSSPNTRVYRGTLGNTTVYLKQFLDRNRTDRFKNLFRRHRAVRALGNDLMLRKAGFSAPQPVIFGYRAGWLTPRNYFYVTRALQGYRDLYTTMTDFSASSPSRRNRLIQCLATTIGRLHKAGFFHGDLRPGNVMIRDDDSPDIALLDNERTRRYRRLPTHQRVKNLTQLNMLLSPHVKVRHRLYFFAIYCRVANINNRRKLLAQVVAKTRYRLTRMVRQGRLANEDLLFLE